MMVQGGEKRVALIRKQQEKMFRRVAQLLLTAVLSLAVYGSAGLFAQGLSGVPQRLNETLSQQSGGGPSSGQPSRQQPGSRNQGSTPGYDAGGSSAPPPSRGQQMSGYPGGSSSGPGLGSPQTPGLGGPAGLSGPAGGSSGFRGGPGSGEMGMEMEMEMEMDGGYGGSGGPGRGISGGMSPGSMSQGATGGGMNPLGGALASMMGSVDLSGFFFPKQELNVQSGPVLGNDAEQAFQAGHYPMALELMFAHMATEYEDASVAIENVRFSPLLKRPVWNIRWGLSIAVRGDDVEDPSPIKEGARPAQGMGFGAGGGPGGRGEFGGFDQSMGEEDFAGGDEEMQMQMDMQMEMEGEMGGLGAGGFPGAPGGLGGPGFPGGPGGLGGAGFPGGRGGVPAAASPSIPDRQMLSASAKAELAKYLGLVESVVAEEFNKRFAQGDFGPLFTSVSAPVQVEPPTNNGFNNMASAPSPVPSSMSLALNDALLDAGEPLQPMWSPGIAYLGQVDSSDSAIAVGEDLQLDLILHFDISLKQIREGLVQNVSRCRLLQVAPPTDSQGRKRHLLITSKGMDNLESQQMAAADRMSEREYINDQLNSLWNLIDRDIKVIDLPKLSSEVANRRISNLLASPKRSMRTLAEVRYYQAMDLINASDVEQVFHIAGGEDGLILLYGPADQRIELSRKWAVESVQQTE